MSQNEINQNTMLSIGATSIGAQNNVNINGGNININLNVDRKVVEQQIRTLWNENFPKLQAEAQRVTVERMEEMVEVIRDNVLVSVGERISEFSDPGVQYALYEAMKSYARYGDKMLLEMLPIALTERVKSDSEYIKLLIDQSMERVRFLTDAQVDYLTALFFCKRAVFHTMNDISELEEFLKYLANELCDMHTVPTSMLISMGFLQLNLGGIVEFLSEQYGFAQEQVKNIVPLGLVGLEEDYGVSDMGAVIAMINGKKKLNINYNIEEFFKKLSHK